MTDLSEGATALISILSFEVPGGYDGYLIKDSAGAYVGFLWNADHSSVKPRLEEELAYFKSLDHFPKGTFTLVKTVEYKGPAPNTWSSSDWGFVDDSGTVGFRHSNRYVCLAFDGPNKPSDTSVIVAPTTTVTFSIGPTGDEQAIPDDHELWAVTSGGLCTDDSKILYVSRDSIGNTYHWRNSKSRAAPKRVDEIVLTEKAATPSSEYFCQKCTKS